MGVKDKAKAHLAKQGYRVAEYIPFGRNWLAYVLRRIGEKKENFGFAIRSLFGS